ncbi:MAG: hypothetical protein KC613_20875 [Myxococcales bacterium]|nr:hypothetical protein [Myxococcales bacterium]
MSDLERHEYLWTKAVDGLLTPAEAAEWQAWLAAHPEDAADFQADQAVKATTDAMAARIRASAVVAPPRLTGGQRHVTTAGLMALGLGAAGLLGFTAWTVLTDVALPLWVRAAAALAGGGAFMLFGVALRQRLAAPDPYREIDR